MAKYKGVARRARPRGVRLPLVCARAKVIFRREARWARHSAVPVVSRSPSPAAAELSPTDRVQRRADKYSRCLFVVRQYALMAAAAVLPLSASTTKAVIFALRRLRVTRAEWLAAGEY